MPEEPDPRTTERGRAEESMREQLALLASAQRMARMGSWRLDLLTGRLSWSEGTCELFGVAASNLQATFEYFLGFVLPEDRPAFERVFASGAGSEAEYRIRRPDGAVRWMIGRGNVERDGSGAAVARIGIVMDVTEQRLAREQLDQTVYMLRIAGKAARLGGWTIELPERKLTWSDENCAIHDVPPGYRPTLEEGIGYFPPEYRDEVIRHVSACERDGTPYEFEVEKFTAKGRRIWVRCVGEAVRDADGRIIRLQGAIQDTSRQKAADDEIRSLGVRLTATLESITDGFFTLDRDWRFTYVNAAAERILECSRGELLGRNVWTRFKETVGTPFEQHYRRALADNTTSSFEAFYPQLEKWFAARVYPSPDGLAVYFQDVTELRRSREAVLESERELRALAESMPQMVWMSRPDGWNNYSNQRWVEYTGLSVEESCGDGWMRAVHPDDRPALEHSWRAATTGRWVGDYNLECRLRQADDGYRWMIVRGLPYRDQAGQITKWMGTFTDIHDLKQSMEAIRVSEERFRLLAIGTHDAIWDWDMRTNALWWNAGFETLFGYRRDEVEASIDSWSRAIHPDEREATLAAVREAIASGADVWAGNYRFRRRDGSYARVSGRSYVIRGAGGRAIRMVGSIADITDRLALEEQLRQGQRLDSIGRLTGGVAHDFNNLLTVIMGNAELLTEQLAGHAKLAPLADMVVNAAERGAELTRHLLAFARKQALEPQAVDVNLLVTDMVPLLQRTLGAHVEILVEPAVGLWRALVDPAQLDNALLNLCVNARDAMRQGGVLTIATANRALAQDYVRQHPGLQPGEYVMLCVSDTGTGIAPEHMGRLFEPFFTTKEQGKGTGLGLAMVYGFVKQSGGHIDIVSEPGRGTSIKLFLPRTADAAAPHNHAPTAAPAAGGAETILLVEDDKLVLRYAHDQLVALGYRVFQAADGAKALEIIRTAQTIDLLFTDMVMPGMSGRQLAEQAVAIRPSLKVLYTSGYVENGIVHEGRLDPGVHLLGKPYRREELARRVREILTAR
jgi:PAS domain S-box-containing protein